MNIAERLTLRLEAFDRRGIHCGHGHWSGDPHYPWKVRTADKGAYCDNAEQAENWLLAHGAVTVKRYDH